MPYSDGKYNTEVSKKVAAREEGSRGIIMHCGVITCTLGEEEEEREGEDDGERGGGVEREGEGEEDAQPEPAPKKRKRRSELAEGKAPSRFSKRQAVLAKAASGEKDKQ